MWRNALRLMVRASVQRLQQAAPPPLFSSSVLEEVAARLPASGMTSSQVQALLEDEFPHFTAQSANFPSVYAALGSRPDLFDLQPGLRGKWIVRAARGPRSSPAEQMDLVKQYCAREAAESGHNGFLPLTQVLLNCGIQNVELVDELIDGKHPSLETHVSVSIRPRRTPRAAIVFVDGDELPASAVDDMCSELALIKTECTVCIVRRPGSIPLSAVDTVSPDVVPTYMCIEKKARELRYRSALVLQDVIYMCSARQFATYAEHVAKQNPFPDADVYVCCPSKIEVVQKKQVIPFEE